MVAHSTPLVYNLQVAEDESFIADGVVVHNCDILATADLYGLGAGMYPPERFPVAPHPFCGCSSTETILRPVSEWATPRGPVPAMSMSIEDINPAALVGGGMWSELRTQRAHATLRAALLHPIGRERRAA